MVNIKKIPKFKDIDVKGSSIILYPKFVNKIKLIKKRVKTIFFKKKNLEKFEFLYIRKKKIKKTIARLKIPPIFLGIERNKA